jgi:hypothetical protein
MLGSCINIDMDHISNFEKLCRSIFAEAPTTLPTPTKPAPTPNKPSRPPFLPEPGRKPKPKALSDENRFTKAFIRKRYSR